jgi:hypothetical protein
MDSVVEKGSIQHAWWIRYGFKLSVFFLALTGFGQMPIFKRYYIADIPGLAWLAKFYVTYMIHYISAIVFIGIGTYVIADFLFMNKDKILLTVSGYLRLILLILITATGVLLVLKNFPGYRFSPLFIAILDFSHLGTVLFFLIAAFISMVLKKQWTRCS